MKNTSPTTVTVTLTQDEATALMCRSNNGPTEMTNDELDATYKLCVALSDARERDDLRARTAAATARIFALDAAKAAKNNS